MQTIIITIGMDVHKETYALCSYFSISLELFNATPSSFFIGQLVAINIAKDIVAITNANKFF